MIEWIDGIKPVTFRNWVKIGFVEKTNDERKRSYNERENWERRRRLMKKTKGSKKDKMGRKYRKRKCK